MADFRRYAVYYAPEKGDFWDFGSAWLGWDAATGKTCPHPEIEGLPAPVSELTEAPRKYGFHATLKAPFELAPGREVAELEKAVEELAARLDPARCDGLQITQLDGFLALVPKCAHGELAGLAATVVTGLDGFRAPIREDRRQSYLARGLSPHQKRNLMRWGYPYVLEDFRFHLTLTGTLAEEEAAAVQEALAPQLDAFLVRPLTIKDLCFFGEAEDGQFHLLHRYALSG